MFLGNFVVAFGVDCLVDLATVGCDFMWLLDGVFVDFCRFGGFIWFLGVWVDNLLT